MDDYEIECIICATINDYGYVCLNCANENHDNIED